MQELITIVKSIINNIQQRREQVKQYVFLAEQREDKRNESFDRNRLLSVEAKRKLEVQIEDMGLKLNQIRQEINAKFNQSIIREITKLETQQEQQVFKFISAFARSQKSIHKV
mmetsp:Transcript_14319/g.24370  ORF Transcript_14319/g.24370 Transcript_14319/m.24370 type:complete len:113 (+) Transcript_14319:1000-1338(+)